MVDAPVSGSVPAAETARSRSWPVARRGVPGGRAAVAQLGKVTYVGANGQGLLLKLAINISLAAQMLAFSEGVLLAERGGVDRAGRAGR